VTTEVLRGSHVAWQEQKIPFPMGKEVLSYAKYFHCSCHAKPLYLLIYFVFDLRRIIK